jgi:hypothetical protein
MLRRRATVQQPGAHEGHEIVELAAAQHARCRKAAVQTESSPKSRSPTSIRPSTNTVPNLPPCPPQARRTATAETSGRERRWNTRTTLRRHLVEHAGSHACPARRPPRSPCAPYLSTAEPATHRAAFRYAESSVADLKRYPGERGIPMRLVALTS